MTPTTDRTCQDCDYIHTNDKINPCKECEARLKFIADNYAPIPVSGGGGPDAKYLQVEPLAPIPESVTYTASNFIPPTAQDILAVLEDVELAGKVADVIRKTASWDEFIAREQGIIDYRAAVMERIKNA